MPSIARPALASFLLLAGACTDESTDPGAHEFRTTWYCSSCGNGNNAPRLDSYETPDLNLDGLPNEQGVTVRGILSPSNVLYRLDAVNDDFRAVNSHGVVVAAGNQLVGWKIVVRRPDSVTKYVTINDFTPDVPSWAKGAATISGYALSYFPEGSPDPVNLCPNHPPGEVAVTLITGETYDADAKEVEPGMTRWVTIACWDEAVYKMKRMNYGPNDNFNNTGQPATVDQRQATLKMITADYCGNGESYTEQGTPIKWTNASLTVNTYPLVWLGPAPAREARWTADGALCLGDPRYYDLDDINCDLPACDNVHWSLPAEWSTFTPYTP